jgi:hypothetical protein
MNPDWEENPPPRFLWCAEYKNCLNEAAYHNLCLDCRECGLHAGPEADPPAAAH